MGEKLLINRILLISWIASYLCLSYENLPESSDQIKNETKIGQECNSGVCTKFYLCGNGTAITNATIDEKHPIIFDYFVNSDAEAELNVDVRSRTSAIRSCIKGETCCSPLKIEQRLDIPSESNEKYLKCGQRNENGIQFKIVNVPMHPTQIGEFPWTIAVLEQKDGQNVLKYNCSGSLIHPSVVLVAAHNFRDRDLTKVTIRAGEWDLSAESENYPHQNRKIAEIIYNGFNRYSSVNDIALLILSEPFEITKNVRTVCLANIKQNFEQMQCFSSAWGQETWESNALVSIQKKIELTIYERLKCQNLLRTTRLGAHFVLPYSTICAKGAVYVDTCTGDGGAALVCPDITNDQLYYFQTGIVSWGIRCSNQFPNVFTNVPLYRNWIDQQFELKGFSKSYYTPQ